MICIECPQGCELEVDAEGGRVIKVTGNKCDKGIAYAQHEIEDPTRILSSTVLAQGLEVKMVPVRTNRPIPKARILEAMEAIRKIRLDRPVKSGDIVVKDLLGTGADLISTREVTGNL
jgi:CxxC motif-containing protein